MGHAIGVAACSPALDLVDPSRQVVESNRHPFRQELQLLCDGWESELARPALAGGLRRQIADESRRLEHAASGGRKGHDQAGPEADPEPALLKGAASAAGAGTQAPKYPPINSAWTGALGPPASWSTSDVRVPIATSKTPGVTSGAGQGDEHRPGLVGRSQPVGTTPRRGEPTRARWASVSTFWTSVGRPLQAAFSHAGRLPQWDRGGPPDPVDDGARLAGDEAVRGGHDPELRAVKPDQTTFRQCRIDALAHVTVDDHDDLPRPDEAGRKSSTVEDEVGRASEEHPVLHAGRLALGSVCDDEWPASVCQECAELASRSGTRRHRDRRDRRARFRPRSLPATGPRTGGAPGCRGDRDAPPNPPAPTARVAGASGSPSSPGSTPCDQVTTAWSS